MSALALTPTVLFSKFNIVLLVRISLEPFSAITSLLRPANEVCEGYVFTGVCLSTGGCGRHPLGRHLPGRPPTSRHPLGRSPPPLGRHPTTGQTPPLCSACWDTVNNRVVRIPLECILVKTMLNFDIGRNAKRYM